MNRAPRSRRSDRRVRPVGEVTSVGLVDDRPGGVHATVAVGTRRVSVLGAFYAPK